MSSFNKKTRNPGYKPGDNWVECERTGMAIRASDARKEWNGLWVAKEEWEPRHPQDYLKSREDNQTPQLTNPESDEAYGADINDDPKFIPAYAGIAVAGVSKPGLVNDQKTDIPGFTFTTDTGTVAPA